MCVLSTLCGNVDKYSPFDIYIYIYLFIKYWSMAGWPGLQYLTKALEWLRLRRQEQEGQTTRSEELHSDPEDSDDEEMEGLSEVRCWVNFALE